MTLTTFIIGFILGSFIYEYLIKLPITLLMYYFSKRKFKTQLKDLEKTLKDIYSNQGLDDSYDLTPKKPNLH